MTPHCMGGKKTTAFAASKTSPMFLKNRLFSRIFFSGKVSERIRLCLLTSWR